MERSVEPVVGRGEVDEVQGVAEDGADPGAGPPLSEAREILVGMVRRPPGAGALREDLQSVAADRLDSVDRRVDPARRGDVAAE